jgi:hypothetical protein
MFWFYDFSGHAFCSRSLCDLFKNAQFGRFKLQTNFDMQTNFDICKGIQRNFVQYQSLISIINRITDNKEHLTHPFTDDVKKHRKPKAAHNTHVSMVRGGGRIICVPWNHLESGIWNN